MQNTELITLTDWYSSENGQSTGNDIIIYNIDVTEYTLLMAKTPFIAYLNNNKVIGKLKLSHFNFSVYHFDLIILGLDYGTALFNTWNNTAIADYKISIVLEVKLVTELLVSVVTDVELSLGIFLYLELKPENEKNISSRLNSKV